MGYALRPHTKPSLFELAGLYSDSALDQIYGDIRDFDKIKDVFEKSMHSNMRTIYKKNRHFRRFLESSTLKNYYDFLETWHSFWM